MAKPKVRTSLLCPYSCLFSPPVKTQENSKDNVNTFLFCASTSCLWVAGVRGAAGALTAMLLPASGYGAGLLPAHHPRCAAPCTAAVTRACCTQLFLVHVGVLLGKNPEVSPSEQASPVQSCRTEELHFFFNLSHKV